MCEWCGDPLPDDVHHSTKYHTYCRREVFNARCRADYARHIESRRAYKREWARRWREEARTA